MVENGAYVVRMRRCYTGVDCSCSYQIANDIFLIRSRLTSDMYRRTYFALATAVIFLTSCHKFDLLLA
jgi:hypothetical protein